MSNVTRGMGGVALASRNTILVTGGSGYIAGYCVAQLLNAGETVRVTVRDLSREKQVRAWLAKAAPDLRRLEFTAANLDQDEGWPEAMRDCEAVLHVASPLPSNNPKHDEDLVRPARNGALRVLAAAKNAGVRRVVMTSSTAAVTYG